MPDESPLDPRPFIRIDNAMPDHPKIAPLTDAAFRTMIELWCYCDRYATDGIVPRGILAKKRPRAVTELGKAGILEQPSKDSDGYMHDYLFHQRSAATIAAQQSHAAAVGGFGAHVRWHRNRGITDADCPHCQRK